MFKNFHFDTIKLILAFFMCLILFFLLEKTFPVPQYLIHSPIDKFIPFNKLFVLPYIAWYPYIIMVCVCFYFCSYEDFRKLMLSLSLGMFICCIVFILYPNGQNLRPAIRATDELSKIVASIYKTDTPTNSLPSIHVVFSIAVHISLMKSRLKIDRAFKFFSFISMAVISISTVFMKQHSIIDVFAGVIVAFITFLIVYREDYFGGKDFSLANAV